MSKIIRESDRKQINLRLRCNSKYIRPSQKLYMKFPQIRSKTNHNANYLPVTYNNWQVLHRFRGNTSINGYNQPYWYRRNIQCNTNTE